MKKGEFILPLSASKNFGFIYRQIYHKKIKIPTRWMISTVKVSISYSCFQARQRNSEAEKDTKSYPFFLWCSKLEWADVTERIMTAKTLVLMGI